jgi:predicted hydrocarbon binding protein
MDEARKYAFNWNLLGDLQAGRPNLGRTMSLEVYRLMQYCMKDVLESRYGSDETDAIIFEAGHLAGMHFYANLIGQISSIGDLIHKLQRLLKELGIGVLRVEHNDEESGELTLTVSEDVDCSGLPNLGFDLCTYDEGFLAAIFEQALGKKYHVREIDCWCTGDRTCRFQAAPVQD